MSERSPLPATPTTTRQARVGKAGATPTKPLTRGTRVKSAASDAPVVSKRPLKSTAAAVAKKPRRVSLGDTSGSTQPERMGQTAVKDALAASQAGLLAAVNDILTRSQTHPTKKAEWLRAILEGAAPDDAKAIRQLLKDQDQASQRVSVDDPTDPNEQLAPDWRRGRTRTKICSHGASMKPKNTSSRSSCLSYKPGPKRRASAL